MWLSFAAGAAALVGFLYIPGTIALLASGLGVLAAICCAPLVSVFLYVVFSVLTDLLNIPAMWATMLFPACVAGLLISFILFCIRRYGVRRAPDGVRSMSTTLRRFTHVGYMDWLTLAVYLGVGILTVGIFFVKNLDGPNPIFQAFDNFQHLGSIETFVRAQRYTPFGGTLYDAEPAGYPNPLGAQGPTFYPCGWYIMGAMVVSALDISVPMAANVVNTVMAAIVFPASTYLMMRVIFSGNRRPFVYGALVTMAFGVFPWGYLVFGPLFPNLMSFALLPAAIALFMLLFWPGQSASRRVGICILFVVGVLSVAIAQPNAVFTAAVFLAPFCVHEAAHIADLPRFSRHRVALRILFSFLALVLIAAIWVGLYLAPPLQDVVQNNWAANSSHREALWKVLTLGLTASTTEQYGLALLVIIGAVYALRYARTRWMVASYVFASIIYYVAASSEGFIKHLLAGFWYTDQYRLAATIAVCGIPLAAIGLWRVFSAACWAGRRIVRSVRRNNHITVDHVRSSRLGPAIYGAVVVIVLFAPYLPLPGGGSVVRAFGEISSCVTDLYSTKGIDVLDEDELAFSRKALDLIPEGAMIINQPNDGSAFLYPIFGSNLYYRYATGYDTEKETEDSRIIRTQLNEISDNPEVQHAVDDIGARYVLLLDMGGDWTDDRYFLFVSYVQEQWAGLNAITDETPGFTMLLGDGDMRLYEITAL